MMTWTLVVFVWWHPGEMSSLHFTGYEDARTCIDQAVLVGRAIERQGGEEKHLCVPDAPKAEK
jgi:hypothetical protein